MSMNSKERNQLGYIEECVQGRLSVQKLCEKLKVSNAGLGNRIIKLNRLQYQESIKNEE